jgi:hypothetical protein
MTLFAYFMVRPIYQRRSAGYSSGRAASARAPKATQSLNSTWGAQMTDDDGRIRPTAHERLDRVRVAGCSA